MSVKLFAMPRGTGKTKLLLEESEKTGYPILCVNDTCRQHIMQMKEFYHYDIPYPYTTRELIENADDMQFSPPNILIDDVPEVFYALFHIKVEAMTVSTN